MFPRLTRCVGYHLMATNKPHFTIAEFSSISHGSKVIELDWPERKYAIVDIVYPIAFGLLCLEFTDGTWIIRRPTDKCFASW